MLIHWRNNIDGGYLIQIKKTDFGDQVAGSLRKEGKMESIFLWGIIVAVLGVLFYRAKPAGKGEWHDDFLSLTTSKSLLGIAAVLIVLHHLAQLLGNLGMDQGPLACLEDVGVCFVGLFFFFSGYGLICSKNGKADYFKTFLRKRFPSILVPFYFCIIIFVIFSLLMQMPMSVPEIAAYLSGWWLLNTQMWYVVEIAFFYLAFYLVFHHVRNEKTGIVIMGVLIGILVASGGMVVQHIIYVPVRNDRCTRRGEDHPVCEEEISRSADRMPCRSGRSVLPCQGYDRKGHILL